MRNRKTLNRCSTEKSRFRRVSHMQNSIAYRHKDERTKISWLNFRQIGIGFQPRGQNDEKPFIIKSGMEHSCGEIQVIPDYEKRWNQYISATRLKHSQLPFNPFHTDLGKWCYNIFQVWHPNLSHFKLTSSVSTSGLASNSELSMETSKSITSRRPA